jgi:NAD(P)-dependent dehydrogenase (short-subunit alcohol dehydrogenase family)
LIKVVLITGATSGSGRAAALQFTSEGAKVSFCGRRAMLANEVRSAIKARGGEAQCIRVDVRNESDIKNFVDRTVEKFGRLDVAFNNAGITLEEPLHEYSSQEWEDVINTNLRGVFLAIRYEIPNMLRSGGGKFVSPPRRMPYPQASGVPRIQRANVD